ncbi:MAG TPA: hypothetical protein VI485_22800 [Vicinamibacterales bacterium]|nr:hypothetical protein [Vicinamibacterales bacterium]
MTKNQRTILLAVLGVIAVLVIAVVAIGVWAATSLFDNQSMDESAAARTLDEVRSQFAGAQPVVDLRPDGAVLLRRPPETKPAPLKTLHVLRWNVQDEEMTRVDVPFSLLRMTDSPFEVSLEPDATGLRVSTSLHVDDIERYGPALLVDDRLPDGGRVLVWSD